MKQLVNYYPTFTPGAAGVGTLDFSSYAGSAFQFDKLYAVINVTRGIPLYIPGVAAYSATQSNTKPYVLVLGSSTSGYSAGDALNIYYDTASGYETNTPVELGGQNQLGQEKLDQILVELRVISEILLQGLGTGTLFSQETTQSFRDEITRTSNLENLNSSQ